MIKLVVIAGFALSIAVRASYDTSTYSSAGRHDHANRCRLRRWQDTD